VSFLEELSQIGAQLDDASRFAAAGGACFEKDAIGDFAGTAEELQVGEPKPPMVLLSSATNVSAAWLPTVSRSFLSSRSMAFFPRRGLKARGSRKISMSSEKRWMRFQPFARLVPPLKMILSGAVVAMSRNASVT
jgi:hypothetical protein